jgi:hypothetical protein
MPPDCEQPPNLSEILALEREILRALCASPRLTSERGGLLKGLVSHDWKDPEHRVVYEALLRTLTRPSGELRLELPATATRMGFPDVEWREYFEQGGNAQVREVISRIQALLASCARLSRQP